MENRPPLSEVINPKDLPQGVTAKLKYAFTRSLNASSTAIHEMAHAMIAFNDGIFVKLITKIPGMGYLGKTVVDRASADVALAAKAIGCDGTGHDEWVAEVVGGGSMTRVRGVLRALWNDLLLGASILDEKKSLSGPDMLSAMDQERQKLQLIDLDLISANKVVHYRTRLTQNNKVDITEEMISPFKEVT